MCMLPGKVAGSICPRPPCAISACWVPSRLPQAFPCFPRSGGAEAEDDEAAAAGAEAPNRCRQVFRSGGLRLHWAACERLRQRFRLKIWVPDQWVVSLLGFLFNPTPKGCRKKRLTTKRKRPLYDLKHLRSQYVESFGKLVTLLHMPRAWKRQHVSALCRSVGGMQRHAMLMLFGWLQSPPSRRPALFVNASFCSGALPVLDFNGLQTD